MGLKSFLERLSCRTIVCSEPVTVRALRRKVALTPVPVGAGKKWGPASNQPADKGINVHILRFAVIWWWKQDLPLKASGLLHSDLYLIM